MRQLLVLVLLLRLSASAVAQTQPASTVPPAILSTIEGITAKRFLPDTAFAALSEEDQTLLAKEPIANWGLAQESGKEMVYYNLIIGTRSYQLVVVRPPQVFFPNGNIIALHYPPIEAGTYRPRDAQA